MPLSPGFRIEGTWLRSRLARRIFLMFCAMAFVPAVLVFALAWRQADRAIDRSEQRSTRAETRFLAFTLLSRLQSADALLEHMADVDGSAASRDARVFDAVVRRTLPRRASPPRIAKLQVRGTPSDAHVVLLAARSYDDGTVIYAGTLSKAYLLRDDEDVVDGTRICVRSAAQAVGCAGQVARGAHTVHDAWDLDLQVEFGATPWRFDTEREVQTTSGVRVRAFLPLAAGVLLMAMLMSLVQIRRTLVPLEVLMDRIRVFAGARTARAAVPATDEIAALSSTFDEMRERIGGQLMRLRGLSAVDSGIVSRAPLDAVLSEVATQLRALPGIAEAAVAVERSPSGSPDIHIATGAGAQLDHARARSLLQAPAHPVGASRWARIVTGELTAVDAYRLHLGDGEDPRAQVLILTRDAALDEDTFDAARQLADRVAIALALNARERRLVHQSRHDALTGLPNRLAAVEALDAAIVASSAPFAVVFMDLDRFKSVNDGLGHALGDALLVEIAGRLRGALPPGDLVARFGGDEFVLLLHDASGADDLDALRQRIDVAFAVPVTLGEHVMGIRYSAGVAFHPADGDSAQDLVRKADVAMYRAKQDGGGRFALYSSGMNEAAREEVELVAALRVALAQDALEVHYQPRIDASTRRLVGMEALVRWPHPQRGWVPPSRFVPLAERHGLIDALGAFVLRTTCAQVAAWRAAGLAPGRVAVNVSSEQLRTGTLVDDIDRALQATGTHWTDLEIEITESLLIADAGTGARQLQALRERGVAVAIDDFGTGYSSLAYLARLPLDTIKIDRAFVVALDEPGTAPVVRSILALAATLGKHVITEGVETEAQLQLLRSWGCDVFQGYLFHRPMPAADVQPLLEGSRDTGDASA